MQHTFEVETKRNVNVVGDYAVISYTARYVGENGVVPGTVSGLVRVSPHDASPDEEIRRDLLEKMRQRRNLAVETTQLTVEDGLP